METLKFKSFEEYGKYIKQTSDDMSVTDDNKIVNKKAIEKNERSGQTLENKKIKKSAKKKSKRHNNSSKKKQIIPGTYAGNAQFSAYVKLSYQDKVRWLEGHNVRSVVEAEYDACKQMLYTDERNPFTLGKMSFYCGKNKGLKNNQKVMIKLSAMKNPQSMHQVLMYEVINEPLEHQVESASEAVVNTLPDRFVGKLPPLEMVSKNTSASPEQLYFEHITKAIDWDSVCRMDDYKKIHFDDFVTMQDMNSCTKRNHDIEPINALVFVLRRNGTIITKIIPASYCRTCKKYYISKWWYEDICEHGIPLWRSITEKKYSKQIASHFDLSKLNAESKLHMNRYNVGSTDNLSSAQRQMLLSLLMECKVCTKEEILHHISWLITSRQGMNNMQNAVGKWKEDRDFVAKYKMGSRRLVGIKLIRHKV